MTPRMQRPPTARTFSRTEDGTPAEEGTWTLTVRFPKPGRQCLPTGRVQAHRKVSLKKQEYPNMGTSTTGAAGKVTW